jgi:hypothetical protein
MDVVVKATKQKAKKKIILIARKFSIRVFCLIMSNLFQNIKNILSKNQSIIHDKPSTIDDTNDCIFNKNEKQTNDLFKHQPDLYEEDQFRACFIDCSCDCSVGNFFL